MLILMGHCRDFMAKVTKQSRYTSKTTKKGFSILLKSWESFFTRRLYHRIQDCWNRPICSSPGVHIKVMERTSKDKNCTLSTTGNTIACTNLGSYNYLGFADDWKTTCKSQVLKTLGSWPVSMGSSRIDMGTTTIHDELETSVAKFIGKERAIVYSMGYGTNTTTIATLLGAGSLIVSDALNHTSIVNGARSSPALIRVFRNNDPAHLDEVLQEAVCYGQPRTRRPWKKILVMVEGIYSMEGIICSLKEIVAVCKKYKAFLYVDEAHSIGALGKTGRGVCEHTGVDPKDVDILMGTFSKSFAGMGGYIASSNRIIEHIMSTSAGIQFHNSLSPVVSTQILTALRVITGEDGTSVGVGKINSLRENSNFFRSEMMRIGLHVLGDFDSPVIPVLIYMPAKVCAFSRECLKRGLAVVVVGFPATSVILARARFCVSAGHTRADLEFAVKVIDEVAEMLCLKYERNLLG